MGHTSPSTSKAASPFIRRQSMEEKIKARIMDTSKIRRSLYRMTTEIVERNRNLKNLVIVGIRTRGIYLGKRIASLIKEMERVEIPVGVLDITLYRDDFSEIETQHMVEKTEIDFSIAKKDVLLVDDVLFTGRTIRAAMDSLFDMGRPQTIQLLVLIDRGHRELPIRPAQGNRPGQAERSGRHRRSPHHRAGRVKIGDRRKSL
jgi:pyrimidine operon attenuation protein/uracil phosphoribosyltransferase